MKKFDDGFYIKTFAELDGTDEGNEKLLMEGVIMGISEIEHYSIFVVTKCPKCKDEQQVRLDDFKDWRHFTFPNICEQCGTGLNVIQHDKETVRKFLFGEDSATNPITMTAFVFKDDVYRLKPGEKIKINGVIRSVRVNPKNETFKRVLDIKQLSTSTSKVIMPTEEEKEEFHKMDKSKIISSIAPQIKGHEIVRESLTIGLLGGVQTSTIRGDINVLLMGDPGVAKTQFLKFCTSATQRSDYTSGKSASQSGLCAGVDNLSDGTRVAKPGSVIMCNGGLCCIDEFEKMNPSDRAGLHEVLETQTYSLRKIGINITWDAKTTIFAAANPRGSQWDSQLSIKENVNLPYSLLSRFGIIILIRDIPNKEFDLEVARHIRKTKCGITQDVLPPEQLKKFINYARTKNPVLTDDAADAIEKYWVDLRCLSQEEGSILIDNRTLQDLYRIAEAYARLDLSDLVTELHAQKAIKLLGRTLDTLGMKSPGQLTESIMKHINKQEFLMTLFKDGITEKSAILKMIGFKHWYPTEESAHWEILQLKNKGFIFENSGKLKLV